MRTCLLLVGLWWTTGNVVAFAADSPVPPTARQRRPVAVVQLDSGLLAVANQCGSLSIVDPDQGQVVRETDIASRISDMTFVRRGDPGPSVLLVTDDQHHELLVVDPDSSRVLSRTAVSPYPVEVTAAGENVYISSLWSRRLTCLQLQANSPPELKTSWVVDLPMAPRKQVAVPGQPRLIVADSFDGRLAVVDTQAGQLLHIRRFPGHNVRGMQISPDGEKLVIAHQMLNELAHSVRNDVHWGLLMSNDLRWLRVEAVLDERADLYKGTHMHPLGEPGDAAADPSGLAISEQGTVIVTLGGVGEVAVGQEDDFTLRRATVGRRPTDVCISSDGRQAFVLNTFADSISIVDLAEQTTQGEISLGPQPELTLVDRGERLFYDGSLSHDSWMSCHSCHTDGHTNGLSNDNFSDGSFGAPKRVLSLLGRADTAPFAWNGGSPTLEDQITKSISRTMQADDEVSADDVAAIVAYLRTLPAPPSLAALRGNQDEQAVARGHQVFQAQGCANCHQPPYFTSPETYDVGLEDELGRRKFNPPSLLGVGQRGPYFHDGRAATLDKVFRKHRHRISDDVTDEQIEDLIHWLGSL